MENLKINSKYNDGVKKALYSQGLAKGLLIGLSVLVLIEAGAVIHLYKKQTINIPYVIEINKEGEAFYKKDVVSTMAKWTPTTATKIKILKDYIENLRSISNDEKIQIERIKKVYAYSVTNALNAAEKYLLETEPLNMVGKEIVECNVYSATPLISDNDNIFQLDWNEKRFTPSNEFIKEENFRAIIKIEHYNPKTESEQEINPLGLYISDLKISKIMDGYTVK